MESKELTSQRKLVLKKEKSIRKIKYDSLTKLPNGSQKSQLYLGVEIFQNNPVSQEPSQKLIVCIKPKTPGIKTLYLAEKDRFNSGKHSHKTTSRQAFGDHESLATYCSADYNSVFNSATSNNTNDIVTGDNKVIRRYSTSQNQRSNSKTITKCLQPDNLSEECKQYHQRKRSSEKCFIYGQPHIIMNLPNVNKKPENCKNSNKVDITPSEDTLLSLRVLKKLQKKIDYLERKILKQEMVVRSIDSNIPTSSSDEEIKETMRTSINGHAGCSYIEQYSHVPETSAFQRYAQQSTSVSANKGTNIGKDHNSEQYGRDFTTYDGITARGRRQSSSVPGKRDDIPKMAAERVHKIRHKLNPVRDYRLMDTVHYLAQGEFAPRDDGIKLTPSREAVLSDIIWEDVCRTHWPNARLARRQHCDRYNNRFELQRLIDNLLRERVAHVERRRRRHYRIVKLNHRHESCRPIGKTGDIIVASHKSRQSNEDSEVPVMKKNAASVVLANNKCDECNPRRSHRSHDRMTYPWLRRKKYKQNDCSPGPSSAVYRSAPSKDRSSGYPASNLNKSKKNTEATQAFVQEQASASHLSNNKGSSKTPRLVVKKDSLRRKYSSRHKPNLEHFILLPTLVVRTPSNIRRQRKFNELYHRVLNVQTNNEQNDTAKSETCGQKPKSTLSKKDVGLNINITLSNSEENLGRK